MKRLGILLLMAVIAGSTVNAATLAIWENDNCVTQVTSTPSDFEDPDVSASDLVLGNGMVAPLDSWENALDSYIYTGVTSLADAIASTHYFGFTVTPDVGKQVDYSDIYTRFTLNDAADGAGSEVELVLMSSVTGFTAGNEIGTFTATHAASQGPTAVTINENTYDVSGVVALQDEPSPIEFRIYVVPVSGSFSRIAMGHIFFANATDDLRVEGTVEEATSLPVVKLAVWENDNILQFFPTNSTPVDVVAAGVSGGDLELGAIGVPGETSGQWWNCLEGWAADVPATNLAIAVATNRYFTFSVTPDPGKQLDFADIATRISVNCGSTASIEFTLMSSLTGFTETNGLGSIIAVDPSGGGGNDNGLQSIDVSGVAELKDVTTAVEFRLYAVINGGHQSRMAIGHINFMDGADDLVVRGTIEDVPEAPIGEATIVSLAAEAGGLVRMVVDAPSASSNYYPVGQTDLLNPGVWPSVPHSDDGVNPLVITNLSYSTAEGTNEVIYLDATLAEKFFRVKSL